MHRIILYTTRRGDSPVDDFLDSLDVKARAEVNAFIDLLEQAERNMQDFINRYRNGEIVL